MCFPLSTAWPARNAARLAISMVPKTTDAATASVAHSTGSRFGTTPSEDRIIPVPYSPVIINAASTPSASWAKNVPVRLVEIAQELGLNPPA